MKELVVSYGTGGAKVDALKSINLAVDNGELLAIMGPSGSGKTTLLMILGLVTVPTKGQLILDGDDIYNGSSRDLQKLRREKVGFIFQFSNLIPFLTAEENILLPIDLINVPVRRLVRGRPSCSITWRSAIELAHSRTSCLEARNSVSLSREHWRTDRP